jgi:hypothetical protein
MSPPAWRDRYARRAGDDRLLTTQVARSSLNLIIGRDGWQLLAAVDHADTPHWVREVPAVAISRRVWMQNYWWDGMQLHWRDATRTIYPRQRGSPAHPTALTRITPASTPPSGWAIKCISRKRARVICRISSRMSKPPAARWLTARRHPRSTPRCSSGAYCPAPISWAPAFRTPNSSSRVRPSTV